MNNKDRLENVKKMMLDCHHGTKCTQSLLLPLVEVLESLIGDEALSDDYVFVDPLFRAEDDGISAPGADTIIGLAGEQVPDEVVEEISRGPVEGDAEFSE